MRDEQILQQLRPDLGLDIRISRPEEVFQNQTLRPILKMQHDLLARLFYQQIGKHKVPYFNWTRPKQQEWIAQTLRKDTALRQLLIGAVVGHFTQEELTTYLEHEPAHRRRLIALLIQRIQSVNFGELPTSS